MIKGVINLHDIYFWLITCILFLKMSWWFGLFLASFGIKFRTKLGKRLSSEFFPQFRSKFCSGNLCRISFWNFVLSFVLKFLSEISFQILFWILFQILRTDRQTDEQTNKAVPISDSLCRRLKNGIFEICIACRFL